MKKQAILLIIILLNISILNAETVRVRNLKILELNKNTLHAQSVDIDYAGSMAIVFNELNPFVQGIEIEIRQTSASLKYPNTIAYEMYHTVNPKPSGNFITYNGLTIEQNILPSRKSMIRQIPTRENHNLKNTTFSKVLPYIHTENAGHFLLKLMPIMKGITTELENAVFTVIVKPLLTNEGGLNLKMDYPETEQPVSLSLNGKTVKLPDDEDEFMILPVGEYQLVINSSAYRTEVRNFMIEQAVVIPLEIKMRSIDPLLIITAPSEAEVYLDQRILEDISKPLKLQKGKHVVKIKVGNYEVVRQITAEDGKTYEVSMTIDVDVKITN